MTSPLVPSNIRIQAGSAKGRRLWSIRGTDVRPALARVRSSMFNILRGRFDDRLIVDLFAGTGSVGLEALSQGARSGIFVDRDPRLTAALRANVDKCGFTDRARIVHDDVLHSGAVLRAHGRDAACIFVDPPYALWTAAAARTALTTFLDGLAAAGVLAADGLVIVEHRHGDVPPGPLGTLALTDRRAYGEPEVSFYARPSGT